MTNTTAKKLYSDLLIKTIANTIYGDMPQDPWASGKYEKAIRDEGRDWPSRAHSMVGIKRLENLRDLVERCLENNIPGDFIETGVWRGGACILMRGILAAHNEADRKVFVCDSFDGLPVADPASYPADEGDTHHEYRELAIPLETVQSNFDIYGLLDDQVDFHKGWFKDTLPALKGHKFALIRLDGDMYQSTMEALENLYEGLSTGGYCIIDDYGAIPSCKQAVDDFRRDNNINEPMESVDWTGVWWQKNT
ncbi:MAG: TylF/MycF family methyltransferase [Pseudomonadota bacterium]